MAQKRVQVREYIWLARFMPPAQPILVECEKCGQCATLRKFVLPSPSAKKLTREKVSRLGDCSCLHCCHQWSVPAGAAFFTAGPLWLKTPCHKNVLWILNREHLDFLEQFIQAELREERLPSSSSRRLSAALPRWMLAGKNRDDCHGLTELVFLTVAQKEIAQIRLTPCSTVRTALLFVRWQNALIPGMAQANLKFAPGISSVRVTSSRNSTRR